MKVQLQEISDFAYRLTNKSTGQVIIHAAEEMSARSDGFRPMEMLLCALASCSAIDLRLILNKQRQQVTKLSIDVEGIRTTGKAPAHFTDIRLHYLLEGDVNTEKAKKAIDLALYSYCSVQKHLSALATITYTLSVNHSQV